MDFSRRRKPPPVQFRGYFFTSCFHFFLKYLELSKISCNLGAVNMKSVFK